MTTIRRFEDSLAWQKANALSAFVHRLSDRKAWGRDWSLREQIRSAAGSVPGNIAEGFNSGGDRHFRHYLRIARASAGEVRAHAYTAHHIGYLSDEELSSICSASHECERLITGFINYLTRCLEQLETDAEESSS